LGEVNHQLAAKHIIMTEGQINIIGATPVEATQSGPGKDKSMSQGTKIWHSDQSP